MEATYSILNFEYDLDLPFRLQHVFRMKYFPTYHQKISFKGSETKEDTIWLITYSQAKNSNDFRRWHIYLKNLRFGSKTANLDPAQNPEIKSMESGTSRIFFICYLIYKYDNRQHLTMQCTKVFSFEHSKEDHRFWKPRWGWAPRGIASIHSYFRDGVSMPRLELRMSGSLSFYLLFLLCIF